MCHLAYEMSSARLLDYSVVSGCGCQTPYRVGRVRELYEHYRDEIGGPRVSGAPRAALKYFVALVVTLAVFSGVLLLTALPAGAQEEPAPAPAPEPAPQPSDGGGGGGGGGGSAPASEPAPE